MRIIIIVITIAILWACDSTTSTKTALSGKDLFKTRCMNCHGTDGRMGMNGAKDLPASLLDIEQRISIVKNGQNLMPSFQGLMSEEEIKLVVEFTMTLK